jgi:hypothetical protein
VYLTILIPLLYPVYPAKLILFILQTSFLCLSGVSYKHHSLALSHVTHIPPSFAVSVVSHKPHSFALSCVTHIPHSFAVSVASYKPYSFALSSKSRKPHSLALSRVTQIPYFLCFTGVSYKPFSGILHLLFYHSNCQSLSKILFLAVCISSTVIVHS